MFKNYFKIVVRNFWKNKTFTLLNLGGLTISLAACFSIFLWVNNELNYDTAGTNANRVYRVALTVRATGQADKQQATTSGRLAGVLVNDFPEVEKSVRLRKMNTLISNNNDQFFSDQFFYADSTFFDVFGYPLFAGNPHTALEGTNSAVITEAMAKKFFGTAENAIGKTITCNDTIPLNITGVAKDIPANNHFVFDMVCSFSVLKQLKVDYVNNWWWDSFYTYILLNDADNAPLLESKIANIMDKYNGNAPGLIGLHFLQPIKSIHLHSNISGEINTNGSITSLRIFITIGIFLLIVACINYINLTTAASFKRSKEIAMRKVAGAISWQLIIQFLSESILTVIIALLLGISLALACLPFFNGLTGTLLSISDYLSWKLLLSLIAFAIVVGVIAGTYPAFYLLQVRPVKVFKNITEKKGSLLSFRKVLVVFQFTLSVVLIVATIVVSQQLHYMQSQNLGFDKEQVVVIPLRDKMERNTQERFKNEIEKNSAVTLVTASSSTPGRDLIGTMVLPEGVPKDKVQTMSTLVVDYNFINAYKLSMAAGRAFSEKFAGDSSAFILNETAVKELGWNNPQNAVGKHFNWGLGKEGTIIGVAKNFHFNSLQQKINPVVMHIMPANSGWYNYVSVRVNTQNVQQTIDFLRARWKALFPAHPFDYFFADEDYNKQYQTEQRLSTLTVLFSGLTIFISCLGLLGLIIVMVSQRVKEIGVRKVLGASITNIAALLSKDFVQLVLIASLIAFPVAWWAMNKWLQSFAYRININAWVFVMAGLAAILIALITVSWQAIRAAMANPVKSLRTE